MALENDLGRDPIRSLVLRIALPSMLAQFVSVLYSIVDRIYIGNIPEIGDIALAGVGVCGPVVTMVGSVASLICLGGSPLIGMSLGQGNEEHSRPGEGAAHQPPKKASLPYEAGSQPSSQERPCPGPCRCKQGKELFPRASHRCDNHGRKYFFKYVPVP